MKKNLLSTTNFVEHCQMHSKSDSSEIMSGFDTDEVIGEFFEYLVQRYKIGLEQSMKGSNFVIDSVDGLHYKCRRGRSYVSSRRWLKNETKTKNKKKHRINHKNVGEHLERMLKSKACIGNQI